METILKEGDDDKKEEVAIEDISNTEEKSKEKSKVKRVNFDSAENTVNNYTHETSDDRSNEEDIIVAIHESEDTFDEVIREKKKEPVKNLRRSSTRPVPGTVKKLMAKFQNT